MTGETVQGHWGGCIHSLALRGQARAVVEPEISGSLCEFKGCHNPKYSVHPRVKFCEEHRDPKNRKE
jgi:hypothetical protein